MYCTCNKGQREGMPWHRHNTLTLSSKLQEQNRCTREYTHSCANTTHLTGGQMFPYYFFPVSRFQTLSYFSLAEPKEFPFPKPTNPNPLAALVPLQWDQHLGWDPHDPAQAKIHQYPAPCTHTVHILTHARFAIWISINLPIVLDNWETGWQRSNLLLTFI